MAPGIHRLLHRCLEKDLGKTELLVESDRLIGEYDVAPDGRFLMLERVEDEGPDRHQLNIVLNWPTALP